jgi:hypothetical protein
MGLAATTVFGAGLGYVAAATAYTLRTHDPIAASWFPGVLGAATGSVSGLATGVAERFGARPIGAAVMGAGIVAMGPAFLALAGRSVVSEQYPDGDIVLRGLGFMTGAGAAGAGAGLLLHALLRR